MFTTAALAVLVSVGTTIFKWFYSKVGRVGTQIVVFILALIGALYYSYQGTVPGLRTYFENAVTIFCVAVAFYEVLLGYLEPSNDSMASK